MATIDAGNSIAAWLRAWWQLIVAAVALLVGWGVAWATLDARIDAVCAESATTRKQVEAIAPEIQRLSQDIAVLRTDVRWIRDTIDHERRQER
jgi:hypothetical protein